MQYGFSINCQTDITCLRLEKKEALVNRALDAGTGYFLVATSLFPTVCPDCCRHAKQQSESTLSALEHGCTFKLNQVICVEFMGCCVEFWP